jgi:hypothetical protein
MDNRDPSEELDHKDQHMELKVQKERKEHKDQEVL